MAGRGSAGLGQPWPDKAGFFRNIKAKKNKGKEKSMATYDVQITGVTSLLQHRFAEPNEADAGKGTRAVHIKEELPRDQAERAAYRKKDGTLYLPGAAIGRMLREAGSAHKQKGSRKSLKYIVPAGVRVTEDQLTLVNGDGKTPLSDFEVDGRPVTIPSTKGRIMRYRPRLDCWGAVFSLYINEDVLDAKTVHQLLVEGGERIGVGDYRPEKGGPFGCFQVTRWEKVKD